jgi:dCTP deaminase
MFLTKSAILDAVDAGEIVIDPFDAANLSPNSYDVRLSADLLVYDLSHTGCLDMQSDNPTVALTIPPDGFVLEPGILYIGSTVECATSHRYIPMFEGRSSIGRLGINTHITAGFGDVGWGFERGEDGSVICHKPTWTLEISVVHPVRIYPNVRIGQVYFVEPMGTIDGYHGKYSKQHKPQASRSFLDFAVA